MAATGNRAESAAPAPGRPAALREIETKFDLPDDFEVPEVGRFAGKGGRVDVDSVELSSTYYDTPTMRLLGFHLTVRRREGVGDISDRGWQLKVPGAGFRTELHWPAAENAAELPPAMLQLLEPFLAGAKAVPAIRLDVNRRRHRVLDADGQLIVEIAHDTVEAVPLGAAVRTLRWAEVEAELGPSGGRSLLKDVGRTLRKAGATKSTSRSKLGRAVVGIGNESIGGARTSAGAVLSEYVEAQVDAIVAGHFAIDQDADDAVHQTRVACRRLRSTLRTFAASYESVAATELGNELQWYAGVLGSVRDLEVLRERLAQAVAELPDDLVVGPVAAQIDNRLGAEHEAARQAMRTAQATVRYAMLLARLVAWRDNPPFTVAAGRPASTLAHDVHHADKVLHKRLTAATEPEGTDTAMHAARKAGKRARYAAEATNGEKASSVGAAKKLQDLLGEFQDSVVAAQLVGRLADQARAEHEDTFTYGVLLAEQRARADAARERARSKA